MARRLKSRAPFTRKCPPYVSAQGQPLQKSVRRGISLIQTVVQAPAFVSDDGWSWQGVFQAKNQYPPVWQRTDGEHSLWSLDGLSVNRSLRNTIGTQESKLDKDRLVRGYLSVGQGMMSATSKVLKVSYHPMARRSDRTFSSKGMFRRRVQ